MVNLDSAGLLHAAHEQDQGQVGSTRVGGKMSNGAGKLLTCDSNRIGVRCHGCTVTDGKASGRLYCMADTVEWPGESGNWLQLEQTPSQPRLGRRNERSAQMTERQETRTRRSWSRA